MRPEARMVAYLLSLPAVAAEGITKIHPMLVPQGETYPAVVYQVLRDWPEADNQGRSLNHWIRIRVTCLNRVRAGAPGYAAVRALADAVEGDSAVDGTPSGLSAWQDPDGSPWVKEESFDEAGTVISGTDQFEVYAINQIYLTAYHL